MELSKHYDPVSTEENWYSHWLAKGYFKSVPDSRPAFTVVIPPPNITGVLHMGHTLNETVQDILVRRARMSGFNACWVPGSDHASIATEARVVQMLKEKGIDKNSLSRDAFMKYAFEWKEKYGSIIYQQIARLGCSVDWDRTNFTMDGHYHQAVLKVFVDLYKKKLIYRGARMINWDPAARTALSDEEVEYRDVEGTLYYIKYSIAGESTFITIATQRPETIMGDTAICVNPNDERYLGLKGKQVIIPLVNRKVPVIFDDYIDISFGTGALKVTPAHDINDYNLGLKYGLPVIDTLNEDGTLSKEAIVFVGMDRFEARKQVVETLRQQGLIEKEEIYKTRLGYSQRSFAVVEPRISTQWFVKMKGMSGPALEAVLSGNIKIHPGDKFLATYKYWLENVEDWCISRQLWWGQRIPAWYDEEGNMVVAETEKEAAALYTEQYGKAAVIKQDEDVLDTWFSSWLWPVEVFNGISEPGNKDINYYYPTSVLVTGQDIIFFWVARMIMAGMEYMKEKPFSDVYFTGMVRDKQGRKMSKSLGNSPDLLQLIDKYGADAVRFGIMISAPAGNDLLFDEAGLEQGRNFNNKLWNALKLVKTVWKVADTENSVAGFYNAGESAGSTSWIPQPANASFAIDWFRNKLNKTNIEIKKLYRSFQLSEALKIIYSLIWDDFCSWYLEWIKPEFGQSIDFETYQSTVSFFEELVELLHPFMPFLTEEIYHLLSQRKEGDDICIRQYKNENAIVDEEILALGELAKSGIATIRDLRIKLNLKSKDIIHPKIKTNDPGKYIVITPIISKMTSSGSIECISEPIHPAIMATSGSDVIYLTTTNTTSTTTTSTTTKNPIVEQKNKLKSELEYNIKFLDIVMKKLDNERFIKNAKPDIINLEIKKKIDTEARIKMLEESLAAL